MPNTERIGPPLETRGRVRRSGVRSNEAGQETRDRLLDAAERLFAKRGLDAVSVRDITAAAGANTAAIHYHFGSKQELVSSILDRRAAWVGARRAARLDELEQRDDVALRDVVDALVRPTADLADDTAGGRQYVALLAALGAHPELVKLVIGAYDPYTDRYLHLLARVTPGLDREARLFRFAVGKDLVNRLIGQPNGQVFVWLDQRGVAVRADLVETLVDLLVGLFEAPLSLGAPGTAPAY